MKIVYVCEHCGTEWDKEVGFCPICYTDLITEAKWNKNKLRKRKRKRKIKSKNKDEMKNRISMALKDPILQQGFEIICKELEAEKKINAEIKVRFVKCNTCTDDMKSKCLMFSENLCQGERCEELVDLMSLINNSDPEKEIAELKESVTKLSKSGLDFLHSIKSNRNCIDCEYKTNIQLTKAKEHIRTLISCLVDWIQEGDKNYCYIVEAEQFLEELNT